MENQTFISVIIPVFNEEDSLPELEKWIYRVMQENRFDYELILVDDGSTDRSWDIISRMANDNFRIRGIRFNRNYGKSAALNTGFKICEGDYVITMDADLQDSPEEIPELIKMLRSHNFDLVSGWKKKRRDPLSKKLPSRFFNYVTSKISGINLHDFNCGLKAYQARVVKNIDVYGEMHRYIPVIAKWHGFNRIGEKVVKHNPRKYGETKFGLERFIFGFLDLLSITFVSRFRKSPMHFFGTLGIIAFLLGLGITVGIIGRKLYAIQYHYPVREVVDQPLFFLALVALVVGVQLFLTGFIAEILTIDSSKRDDYIILEEVGGGKKVSAKEEAKDGR